MDTKRKEFQLVSLGMFALIILQISRILQIIIDMDAVDTTGMSANAIAAMPFVNGLLIGISAIGVIVLAILGVKGLREVSDPTSSRYHIILASIASVFFGLGLIAEIVDLFRSGNLSNEITTVMISSLFFIDTLHYAVTAKALRTAK